MYADAVSLDWTLDRRLPCMRAPLSATVDFERFPLSLSEGHMRCSNCSWVAFPRWGAAAHLPYHGHAPRFVLDLGEHLQAPGPRPPPRIHSYASRHAFPGLPIQSGWVRDAGWTASRPSSTLIRAQQLIRGCLGLDPAAFHELRYLPEDAKSQTRRAYLKATFVLYSPETM
jgi:hypothetical protein